MTSTAGEKESIRELLSNYCFYSDNGHAEDFSSLFTEDGELDLGEHGHFRGKPALLELQKRKGGKYTPIRHCTMNSVIAPEGEFAKARSYLAVLNLQEQPPKIIMVGHYFDHLVKQDGQWLFHRRLFRTDPVEPEIS